MSQLLITLVSTAGGSEEQQDYNIYWGLNNISKFIRTLHQGRNPSFSPLPALSKTCEEQIEEEGSDEEIEAQLINRGQNYGQIKDHATEAKQTTLNIYVDRSNARQ
ncbi:MAG: hypothetical protein EZS28_030228 [Streblomastix strix]|uniref:Uncharacterized protein n=1 Tax=Streblomastix strix TaxID=222440 RepID=A0A5J4UUD2_9EUKA|nr:MAG: hypothetical protein EZS28_030228 [Streblomastix strix]